MSSAKLWQRPAMDVENIVDAAILLTTCSLTPTLGAFVGLAYAVAAGKFHFWHQGAFVLLVLALSEEARTLMDWHRMAMLVGAATLPVLTLDWPVTGLLMISLGPALALGIAAGSPLIALQTLLCMTIAALARRLPAFATFSATEVSILAAGVAALVDFPSTEMHSIEQSVLLTAISFSLIVPDCTAWLIPPGCPGLPPTIFALLFSLWVGGVLYPFLYIWVLQRDPFIWVIESILAEPARCWLCGYWITLLGVTLAVAAHSPHLTNASRKHVIRKGFHALAVVMFVPGIVLDASFMGLAFAVALGALLLVECLRISRVAPFDAAIEPFVRQFTDERDAAGFIRTHLYLLVGCACPVWYTNRLDSTTFHSLTPYSGALVLGVTDAVDRLPLALLWAVQSGPPWCRV
eukprot:NODE_1319_length_1587_cov_32.704161_g1184_i0.p1 GENE.NODE_1319_length_1587_cov_32.704161_g1184_i0~~NODE_1319_length_1587_cov_32.704161_g1184_i0.p1  ORF type:complete len:406 (+),score=27.07 NODE_1319_length_1587_cov_32.704161_g1184_i0:104-1321(+)